jgi:hypothetical protein
MAIIQIVCQRNENVFQAFARAVRTGTLPASAKLFPLRVGVLAPEAPPGYVTVATILIRPRESFAVGVPQEAAPQDLGTAPPGSTWYETGRQK